MLGEMEPGWIWAIAGLLLLVAEIFAPGFFLMFVGAAALATGLFTILFDLGIAPQLVLFVIYTALAVLAGKRWYAEPATAEGALKLNDPSHRLIGKVVTVVTPVDEHGGRVKVGDSEWNARGDATPAGERVRVSNVDGNTLLVERLTGLPSPE